MSALQRCLYYSQTSLIWTCDTTKCPHHRGVCITVKPPDTDTNEIKPSVYITEVSVLQSNLLNMDVQQNQVSTSQRCLYYSQTSWYRHQWDRAKCLHYRGVCITVKPPDTDIRETEPSVYITEVSVLQSNLLIMDVQQNQVSTSQRCLYCSQTSWYRHQWDRAKCLHYRGFCITVEPPDTDTNEIEPSVYIAEESVLQSNLLIQTSVW